MEDFGNLLTALVYLTIGILTIVGMWKAFEKAGEAGWACLIPFYNIYVMCRMGGKPGWWLLLCLIPLVGLVVLIIISIGIAQNFGKGAGFGVGLALLSFIFWPILGFGDARFRGVIPA